MAEMILLRLIRLCTNSFPFLLIDILIVVDEYSRGRGGALLLWKVYNSKLYLNKALRKSECKVSFFPNMTGQNLKLLRRREIQLLRTLL